MTYEASVQRLQAIVSELEGDRLPLAQALALFEEGVARLREATAALADAGTREFSVPVPKGKEATLTYRVAVRW